jgi:hypothetical protein
MQILESGLGTGVAVVELAVFAVHLHLLHVQVSKPRNALLDQPIIDFACRP